MIILINLLHFQFHKGAIETEDETRDGIELGTFNSIKVRLKQGQRSG